MPAQLLALEQQSSWLVLAVSLSYVSAVDVIVVDIIVVDIIVFVIIVDSIVVFIVVSGASSDIGSGTAIQLAGAGFQLVIC